MINILPELKSIADQVVEDSISNNLSLSQSLASRAKVSSLSGPKLEVLVGLVNKSYRANTGSTEFKTASLDEVTSLLYSESPTKQASYIDIPPEYRNDVPRNKRASIVRVNTDTVDFKPFMQEALVTLKDELTMKLASVDTKCARLYSSIVNDLAEYRHQGIDIPEISKTASISESLLNSVYLDLGIPLNRYKTGSVTSQFKASVAELGILSKESSVLQSELDKTLHMLNTVNNTPEILVDQDKTASFMDTVKNIPSSIYDVFKTYVSSPVSRVAGNVKDEFHSILDKDFARTKELGEVEAIMNHMYPPSPPVQYDSYGIRLNSPPPTDRTPYSERVIKAAKVRADLAKGRSHINTALALGTGVLGSMALMKLLGGLTSPGTRNLNKVIEASPRLQGIPKDVLLGYYNTIVNSSEVVARDPVVLKTMLERIVDAGGIDTSIMQDLLETQHKATRAGTGAPTLAENFGAGLLSKALM